MDEELLTALRLSMRRIRAGTTRMRLHSERERERERLHHPSHRPTSGASLSAGLHRPSGILAESAGNEDGEEEKQEDGARSMNPNSRHREREEEKVGVRGHGPRGHRGGETQTALEDATPTWLQQLYAEILCQRKWGNHIRARSHGCRNHSPLPSVHMRTFQTQPCV